MSKVRRILTLNDLIESTKGVDIICSPVSKVKGRWGGELVDVVEGTLMGIYRDNTFHQCGSTFLLMLKSFHLEIVYYQECVNNQIRLNFEIKNESFN